MVDQESFASHFEETLVTSNYHFDRTVREKPGEWFFVLGKFKNIWQSDLDNIKSQLRPMSWDNIRSTCGGTHGSGRNPNLQKQHHDIVLGGGDPHMTLVDINDELHKYQSFQKIIDFFELDQSARIMSRLHVQQTGQVFNYHIDTLNLLFPDSDPDKIIRFTVQLEDWCPGQFYLYGNCTYDHWSAGEVHWFKWKDVPHGTANASRHPRCSLQITGIKTSGTESILKNNKNFDLS